MFGSGPSRGANLRHALLWTGGALLVCLIYGALTFPLSFNTNDDPAMMGISLGLFSDELGDPRLVHQSAFLGALIGGLFRLSVSFDWYSAFQWAVCLSGFAVIGIVLLRRDQSIVAGVCFGTVASIFFAPILFHMQFTQTSFVCVATGVVVALDSVTRERIQKRGLALALGFLVLAAMIRSASLMAAQLLLVVMVLGLVGVELFRGRRIRGLRGGAALLGLVVLASATVAGLRVAEAAIFYGDPAWNDFFLHHADRAFVLDNWPRHIGLQRIADTLQRDMGISPQQLVAMLNWLPIDVDLYSLDRFSEMANVIRSIEAPGPLSSQHWSRYLEELSSFLEKSPIFTHSLVLMGLMAAWRAARRPESILRELGVASFWAVLSCVLIVGIGVLFRWPPYRVWMPIVMLCVLGSMATHAFLENDAPSPETDDESFQKSSVPLRREVGLALAFAVGLIVLAPVHRDFRDFEAARKTRHAQKCALTRAHVQGFERLPEGARIFLAPRIVHADCYLQPFRIQYPEVLQTRTISFGWRNLTPWIQDELFAQHDRLFDAVCRDPRNMFVLHPIDWPEVENYLRRHEPGVVLSTYAPDLPPAILSCHREALPVQRERLIGAR